MLTFVKLRNGEKAHYYNCIYLQGAAGTAGLDVSILHLVYSVFPEVIGDSECIFQYRGVWQKKSF